MSDNGRCEAAMIFERDVTECKFGIVHKFAPDSEVNLKFVPEGGDLVTATGDTVTANFVGQATTGVSIKNWGYYTIHAFGTGPQGQSVTAEVPLTVKSAGYFTPGEILTGYVTMLMVVLFFILLIRHLKRVYAYECGEPAKPSLLSNYYKGALHVRHKH